MKITKSLYVHQEETLYLGLSNGEIHAWKKRMPDKVTVTQEFIQKDCDLINFSSKNSHKGDITSLLYEERLYEGLMVSGSADSKIKIWVKDLREKTKKYSCTQTLVEHNGTILAMAISGQANIIASSSTDTTIKIWKQQSGRDLLLYPFYICIQTLTEHLSLKSHDSLSKGVWVSALVWKEGDDIRLLAGDSKGTISIYKLDDNWRENTNFTLDKTGGDFHSLIISQLLLVPQENFLFSISFDQYFKGLDATNGSEFVTVRNLNRCYFTALVWDYSAHELIAGDEKGFVGVWNVYHERPMFWGKLFKDDMKIIGLALRDARKELVVTTETIVEVFYLKRGQSSHDIQGHEGPIISIHAQEVHQIHRLHSNNKPRFITSSVDNTVKVWDLSDLSVTTSMTAPARSEISCMCFLPMSSLIATGHENGYVMLWNPEIHESVRLKCDADYAHKNTVTAVAPALYDTNIEYLISVGYDARICIWEITEKNSAFKQAVDGSAGITVAPSLRNHVQTYPHEDTAGHELLCVIYDPHTENIIVGSNSSLIKLVSIQTTDERKLLAGHLDSVTALALEYNILFSGSDDRTIRLWDMKNCQGLSIVLNGHTSPIRHLLVIIESGHLVSCAHDGKLLLWKTNTYTLAKTVQRADQLNCLAFLSLQNIILVGTEQSTIITVPIEPEFGNPHGLNNTVNKAELHMEKKVKMKRGEHVDLNDDTRSVQSEDILEEYPDPSEELLRKVYNRNKSKK